MSVEKVRHAQRECLSERVIWFACALVKEKVEMCAGIMDFSVLFKFIASIQWVSAVNVSGLRRQSHTACMTTSSLSIV